MNHARVNKVKSEVSIVKVVAINGSARKNANTAMLLNKALEGAYSVQAEVELVHLVDLNYKGCVSCFACHHKGTKLSGSCALKDELTPILEKVMQCDVLILGSPIYLGDITSMMRAFLERLVFMNHTYDNPSFSNFNGSISCAFIYTMGVSKCMAEREYGKVFEINTNLLKRFNGRVEQLVVTDTYQFDDYSKYPTSMIDLEQKAKSKDKQFPLDCEKAFNIGKKLGGSK